MQTQYIVLSTYTKKGWISAAVAEKVLSTPCAFFFLFFCEAIFNYVKSRFQNQNKTEYNQATW